MNSLKDIWDSDKGMFIQCSGLLLGQPAFEHSDDIRDSKLFCRSIEQAVEMGDEQSILIEQYMREKSMSLLETVSHIPDCSYLELMLRYNKLWLIPLEGLYLQGKSSAIFFSQYFETTSASVTSLSCLQLLCMPVKESSLMFALALVDEGLYSLLLTLEQYSEAWKHHRSMILKTIGHIIPSGEHKDHSVTSRLLMNGTQGVALYMRILRLLQPRDEEMSHLVKALCHQVRTNDELRECALTHLLQETKPHGWEWFRQMLSGFPGFLQTSPQEVVHALCLEDVNQEGVVLNCLVTTYPGWLLLMQAWVSNPQIFQRMIHQNLSLTLSALYDCIEFPQMVANVQYDLLKLLLADYQFAGPSKTLLSHILSESGGIAVMMRLMERLPFFFKPIAASGSMLGEVFLALSDTSSGCCTWSYLCDSGIGLKCFYLILTSYPDILHDDNIEAFWKSCVHREEDGNSVLQKLLGSRPGHITEKILWSLHGSGHPDLDIACLVEHWKEASESHESVFSQIVDDEAGYVWMQAMMSLYPQLLAGVVNDSRLLRSMHSHLSWTHLKQIIMLPVKQDALFIEALSTWMFSSVLMNGLEQNLLVRLLITPENYGVLYCLFSDWPFLFQQDPGVVASMLEKTYDFNEDLRITPLEYILQMATEIKSQEIRNLALHAFSEVFEENPGLLIEVLCLKKGQYLFELASCESIMETIYPWVLSFLDSHQSRRSAFFEALMYVCDDDSTVMRLSQSVVGLELLKTLFTTYYGLIPLFFNKLGRVLCQRSMDSGRCVLRSWALSALGNEIWLFLLEQNPSVFGSDKGIYVSIEGLSDILTETIQHQDEETNILCLLSNFQLGPKILVSLFSENCGLLIHHATAVLDAIIRAFPRVNTKVVSARSMLMNPTSIVDGLAVIKALLQSPKRLDGCWDQLSSLFTQAQTQSSLLGELVKYAEGLDLLVMVVTNYSQMIKARSEQWAYGLCHPSGAAPLLELMKSDEGVSVLAKLFMACPEITQYESDNFRRQEALVGAERVEALQDTPAGSMVLQSLKVSGEDEGVELGFRLPQGERHGD